MMVPAVQRCLLLLILQACPLSAVGGNSSKTYRTEFLEALMFDYNNRIPPGFERNVPTDVDVSLFINSIDSISEKTMDYTLSAFIQQEWVDDRLVFLGLIESTYLELDSKIMKEVWVPDLYFTNEKKAFFHDITVPNRMMHLHEDGLIVYRSRVSITASCPMNLQKYPFDTQICSLYLQSFAFTEKSLKFRWKKEKPIRLNRNLQLPQFRLINYNSSTCDDDGNQFTANFTCIRMDLFLQRNLGFYMIQIYIPTILIVMLSWVSFWLSIDAVPARISLGILTVLTMTSQRTNAVAAVPPVSYVKAMDIWMAVCLGFVFASLLEFALAYVVQKSESKISSSKPLLKNSHDIETNKGQDIDSNVLSHSCNRSNMRRAKRIDSIAKLLFPGIFLVFMVAYWVVFQAM